MIRNNRNRVRSAILVGACAILAVSFLPAQDNSMPADAQTASASLPRFEVAAIKPGKSQPPFIVGLEHYPSGRVVITNFTLSNILMFTFGVAPFQITGGPAWINSDRFVIQAEASPSPSATQHPTDSRGPLTLEERKMLLALLIDRFQLRYHVGIKEGPVFLLERGKGKLALQPPKSSARTPGLGTYRGSTGLIGHNISMPELAVRLSGFLQRHVIDKTGICGSYDFDVKTSEFDPNAKYSREDSFTSTLAAIHDLGLNLKSAKGPVETIVIDSAAQPSPN